MHLPYCEGFVDTYRWFSYPSEVTGLQLIGLEDLPTGTIVSTTVANPQIRTSSVRAWAGARHSRSAQAPWEILAQIHEKNINADQKLTETFHGYGHASVGDMARLQVDFTNIPMHLCLALFNESSVNSGQEKSTRYQSSFGSSLLHPIELYFSNASKDAREEYQQLGSLAHGLFLKYQTLLHDAFKSYFQINENDRKEASALKSRVLDCTRSFLLLGQNSGMSFETSARDWSRIIAELKGSPLVYYRRIALQIERLLAPSKDEEDAIGYQAEAPGLLRHTAPQMITNNNIDMIKYFLIECKDSFRDFTPLLGQPTLNQQCVRLIDSRFSESDRLLAQIILLTTPAINVDELMRWISEQSLEIKQAISSLLYQSQNNYCEMPQFARTTRLTLLYQCSLGELRDFNRHRAWGRFFSLPLVFGPRMRKDFCNTILSQGFILPAYLTDIPEMITYKEMMEKDLMHYYSQLQNFCQRIGPYYYHASDFSFVLNLLPLAHRVDLWMHGDPKQALYLTTQRTRPGGHINYRLLAHEAAQLLADFDPYLAPLALKSVPDPKSRAEFLDRS